MKIEFILYPTWVAVPGIVWLVYQFSKHQQTNTKKWLWWQLSKLVISVVIILAFSAWASFLVFGTMLGTTSKLEFIKLLATQITIYLVASFLLGQWIMSTRLGNIFVSVTSSAVAIYFVFINPVLIVKPLAESNFATAQYLMGHFYETGSGGVSSQSEQVASQWYARAGKQGHISAARTAVKLLPPKNPDRIVLLKLLASHEPNGKTYYELWQSRSFIEYAPDLEREKEAEQWLMLAAEYGHRDAILGAMSNKYSLESSCRLSPKSYAALPEFEKWVAAYENNRGNPDFDEKELQYLKERVSCLAGKVAEAKAQDAQLSQLTRNIFSRDRNTQTNALATLRKMGPRAITAVPDLLKLAHTNNYSTAWYALTVIHDIDPEGESVTQDIMAMLTNRAAHIRVNGAYGVALYANTLPDAMPQLDMLLDDPNNEVAGRAALALAEYGKMASASLWKIDTLAKRRDSRLSSYARQASSKIKNDERAM